jgi:hypothetical protein
MNRRYFINPKIIPNSELITTNCEPFFLLCPKSAKKIMKPAVFLCGTEQGANLNSAKVFPFERLNTYGI